MIEAIFCTALSRWTRLSHAICPSWWTLPATDRQANGSAPGLVDVSNVGGRSQEGCRNAEAFPAGVQA